MADNGAGQDDAGDDDDGDSDDDDASDGDADDCGWRWCVHEQADEHVVT